jgi:hypothetical protein
LVLKDKALNPSGLSQWKSIRKPKMRNNEKMMPTTSKMVWTESLILGITTVLLETKTPDK